MATTPISGLAPVAGTSDVAEVQSVGAGLPATETETTHSADDAVSIDVFPSSPPAEVLAAISTASAAYDSLSAAGLHVSFDDAGSGSGLEIAAQDQDGNPLSALKPSEVLALADGEMPSLSGSPASVPASDQPAPESETSDVDDEQFDIG